MAGQPGQQQSLKITLEWVGVREVLAAFRQLPRDASDSLRERSTELAGVLAGRVASAARADSPQAALMAATVKALRDRVPSISAGGTSRVGRNSKPAYKILFGSEFGARTLPQFRPHVGRRSYWFFQTVDDNEVEIAATWEQIANDIVKAFGPGGGI